MLGELSESEIDEMLDQNYFGRIGCTDGKNVYIVPVNYHYEKDAVLCYSLEGTKIDMMRQHPHVCFEIDQVHDSNNWKCIIIDGTFKEITDEAELKLLRPHYTEYLLQQRVNLTRLPTGQGEEEQHRKRSQVFYRIRFDKVSGRYENGF